MHDARLGRHTYVLITLAAAGIACQARAPNDLAGVEERLDRQSEQLEGLAARLGTLEEKVGAGKRKPARARPDAKLSYRASVDGAHFKGKADAKITIVEWSDFQCPYCRKVTKTTDQLLADYGGEVRIVFKHMPVRGHARALPAALAAEAAGRQGKFWGMHDLLFANQRELSDENIERWAGELGLDVARFRRDLADPGLRKRVDAQQAHGARLGVSGTPAFFVNGRFISGAQPLDRFKRLIDEELRKADALLAKGTPRQQLYEAIMKSAKPAL